MTLLDFRTAIKNTVQNDSILKAMGVHCDTHQGRFTLDDLKVVATRPLTALVAGLAVKQMEIEGGVINFRCVWGIYVVCSDRPQLPRDAAALVIITRLGMIIPGNCWGLDDASAPEEIESQNLYAAPSGTGVVIWAITWEQKMQLAITDISTLDDFLLFHADYDFTPGNGTCVASDDVVLPGPEL